MLSFALLVMLVLTCMHFRILKMIATSGYLTAPNSFSAGALPQTVLAKLTVLTQTPS